MLDLPLSQSDYLSRLFEQTLGQGLTDITSCETPLIILNLRSKRNDQLRWFNSVLNEDINGPSPLIFELKSNRCGHQVMANCRKSQDR